MRERIAAVVAIGLVVAVTPPVVTALLAGASAYEDIHRGYPGAGTAVAGAVLRGMTDLASVTTLGALVTVLFLRPRRAREAHRLRAGLDLTLLTWSSGTWTVLAATSIVVSAADANGLPLSRLFEPGALTTLYGFGYMPRAWTVTALGALLTWVCSYWASRWTTLLPGLWSAVIAALAPVVVGQILVGPNHDVGGDAGVLRVVLVSLALGPLLGRTVLAHAEDGPRARSLIDGARLERLALIGAAGSLAVELVLTWFTLAGTSPIASATGLFALSRIVLLAGLTMLLLLDRRGTTGPSVTSLGLLVGVIIALGAAMTLIPPPHYFVPTSIPQVFMGYDVPNAPTIATLVSPGRLNLLFAVLGLAGVSAYLVMVRRLRRKGVPWPFSRTVLWCGGWLVVVYATNSGFGKYSAPDFGVHMVVHMSLAMLGPILLVQGGVVTLILRSARVDAQRAGIHAWVTQTLHWRLLRVLYHPAAVFILFVGSYYLLYFSPLFEMMMRFHWAHQLMNLHFLVTGYAYYSLIIGVDRPPRPLPHIGRLGYTLAAMPFHAFFGVAIISAPGLFAETFYRYLDLPWADLETSQQVAGAVAWAGGEVPLIIAVVALCIQWARDDDKEARRRDRHIDRGLDPEFDAYNEMLRTLSERNSAR